LMMIAQYFCIDTLIKLCESHMITRINVNNAVAWLKIADEGACHKLKSVAIEYIVENNLSFLSSAERQVTLGEELWNECMEYMTAHYKVVKKSGEEVKNGK